MRRLRDRALLRRSYRMPSVRNGSAKQQTRLRSVWVFQPEAVEPVDAHNGPSLRLISFYVFPYQSRQLDRFLRILCQCELALFEAPAPMSAADFAAFVSEDVKRWAPIDKQSGTRLASRSCWPSRGASLLKRPWHLVASRRSGARRASPYIRRRRSADNAADFRGRCSSAGTRRRYRHCTGRNRRATGAC